MKIHVFQRPDGSHWADFADLGARAGHKRVVSHTHATREDLEKRIADPGEHAPERVRALAERMLAELLARNQQPEAVRAPFIPTLQPAEKAPEKPRLVDRLKRLLTGG